MKARATGLFAGLALLLTAGCGTQLTHEAIVRASVQRTGAPDSGSRAAGLGVAPGAGNGRAASSLTDSTGPAGSAPLPAGGAVATVAGSAGTPTAGTPTPGTPAGGSPAKSAPVSTKGATTVGPGPAASGGGSAAPAGAPTPAGGDRSPFVIGSVGTQGGIVGASVADGTKALRAWVTDANARGGLAGRPVSLIVGDDGADPARHQSLVQQLVEEKGVIAFVYNSAPLSGQSSLKYLTDKRVPVIGSELAGQWFYESPMFFPQGSTGLALVYNSVAGVAAQVVPQGKTKVAFLNCQEAQYCTDADRIWPQIAPGLGFQVVSRARASLAQPDFTAECLGAKNAGAQVLIMAMDSNSVGRVASSCARADFHPVLSWASTVTLDRHKDDPNLEGAVIPVPLEPWFLTDKPAVAQFVDTLKRYAPGVLPSGSSENGWVAAKLFEKAAAAMPATGKPTSAGLLDGLWGIRNETLGGLTYPITFHRDQKATEVDCWYPVVISKGAFNSPDGGALHCKG
jgi:branched-chain amino acid transport system substrate-binding protein